MAIVARTGYFFPHAGKIACISSRVQLRDIVRLSSCVKDGRFVSEIRRWRSRRTLPLVFGGRDEQIVGENDGPVLFPPADSSDLEGKGVFDPSREACAAVAEFLVQAGLSEEDALRISGKAPAYVQRLIDDDKELRESGFGEVSSLQEDSAVYRSRILQIANRTGRHLIPFLESVGVRVTQIPRIAHQLSGKMLPDILGMVNFLEELVTPPNDGKNAIEGQIRSMMKRMSLDVDEDLQRTLSFFEKIEAQRGGLSVLNCKDKAVALIVENFPHILLRSLEFQLKPVVAYLEEVGVPREDIGRVFLCFPPCLLYDVVDELKPRMKKLRNENVRARDLGRMIVKYPWLLSRCVEDNVDKTFAFLKAVKVPNPKLTGVVTQHPILFGGSSTRTFQPMVDAINNCGLKSKRLGKVIPRSPNLLLRASREFRQVVEFLHDLGIEDADLKKLLQRSPELFSANLEKAPRRNLSYLEELGVPRAQLGRIVKWYPEVLSMSVDMSIKPRMDYLQDRGASRKDVAWMIQVFPPILGYSVGKVLKPKLDYLVDSMGGSVEDVVKYPRFFSYSLEKKIKPRTMLLARRGVKYDLPTLLVKSYQEFTAEYVEGRLFLPIN